MISVIGLFGVICMILYWALFSPPKGFWSHKGFTTERVFNEVNIYTKSCIVLKDEKARSGVMSRT